MNKMRITWGEVGKWFVYGRMKLKCFLDLSMWFISERMDNDRYVWSSKKDFDSNWKVGAKVVNDSERDDRSNRLYIDQKPRRNRSGSRLLFTNKIFFYERKIHCHVRIV
jgi:hypothetical protein